MPNSSSDAVTAACDRLNGALDALESRIETLKRTALQSQQVAKESKQLIARHGTLTEENKKLKHGLQDAELQQSAQRRRAGEMLTHVESAIVQLERAAS